MCIEDPDYEVSNLTFEDGSIENDIIQVLDTWSLANSNGLADEEDAMIALDAYVSQIFAPYWAINDINDTAHKSTDYYNSNLTLLEFFHTDCGHCSAQIPALKEFHSNHSSDVNVISVGGYSMGGNFDNLSNIQEFASEHNVSWTYLYDEDVTLMSTFGLNSYPSWVLLEGDMETGEAQIVGTSSGTKSYDSLVEMVTNHTVSVNVTEQMDAILENLYHWRLGHVSDSDMLGIIASSLNYEFDEEDIVENYGVTHSSRLYIIDQNGELRVLWKGTDWTYASIYHDIQILL
jgi:peroxiredoxin